MTESTPMKGVSHTNHHAATSLRRLYARGEEPVPDGGQAETEREADDVESEAMRDVEHTTSDETEPNRVFERGGEFEDE